QGTHDRRPLLDFGQDPTALFLGLESPLHCLRLSSRGFRPCCVGRGGRNDGGGDRRRRSGPWLIKIAPIWFDQVAFYYAVFEVEPCLRAILDRRLGRSLFLVGH